VGEIIILPSAIDVVVDWARSIPAISEAYDGRISSKMPLSDKQVTYPWLTAERVIGLPVSPETAVDRVRIQFNSWGGLRPNSRAPEWGPADLGIRTVEAYVRGFQQAYVESRNAVIEDMAGLEGIQQLTDPDTGGARFWMDAIVVVRNA
jgi:hypothetical protein